LTTIPEPMFYVFLSLKLSTPLKGRDFESLRGILVTATTEHWLQCFRKAVSGSSFGHGTD